jgi:hypothetical protein
VAQSAEFILEPDQKQILVLEPWGPSFEGVVQAFSSREGIQVVECSTITDLTSVAKQISHCVVLAYCAGTSESERYRDLLKALQPEILAKKIRVLIAIGENRDLKTVFLQDGASEVFEEPVGEKVLASKVEHALTLLTARKQAAKKSASFLKHRLGLRTWTRKRLLVEFEGRNQIDRWQMDHHHAWSFAPLWSVVCGFSRQMGMGSQPYHG